MEPKTAQQSPAQLLATLLIGEPVVQWINHRRALGATWKVITREIHQATNGQLDLTEKTVRDWAAQ
jgi:hypothetical protein